jgi:hypothetical protein
MPLSPTTPDLAYEPAHVPPEASPVLFVVIDTEEEFDWHAPLSREALNVDAMRHIGRAQDVLARHRVTPTYVVDFAVASQPAGYGLLRELAADGACRIGAHLHPWVNPPYEEDVTPRNSYACNLPADLERAKLAALVDTIGANLGVRPRTYKAGRYGFGVSTMGALQALAFDVDVSINPHMDFSEDGGPSFDAFDTTPFWFGRERRLLEVPCTGGFVGYAGAAGPALRRFAERPGLRALRAPGVLARAGVVDKVQLSPEGNSLRDLCALTTVLLARGVRTFALTFHSPSVVPGCTPYVRTPADLDEFLGRIDGYCDFFLNRIGGHASTPEQFRDMALRGVTS